MLRRSAAAMLVAQSLLRTTSAFAADLDGPVAGPPPIVVAPPSVLVAPVYAIPTCGFFTACAPLAAPYALAVGAIYAVPVVPVPPNPMDFHDERNDYNQ